MMCISCGYYHDDRPTACPRPPACIDAIHHAVSTYGYSQVLSALAAETYNRMREAADSRMRENWRSTADSLSAVLSVVLADRMGMGQ